MKDTLQFVLAALVGLFVTLYWHISSMPLSMRLEQKIQDDTFQRSKCINKQDMVCADYYDRKLHTLKDIYNKNQQPSNAPASNAWMALMIGAAAGVGAAQVDVPVTATLAGVSFLLYWHESHYQSLETLVGRHAADLSQDPAVIAYDCHRIVSKPHPTKAGTQQRYVEPIEACVKRRTTDRLEDLQRLGFMPAVKVDGA